MGGAAGRRLRRAGGKTRRVLRIAHTAQARGIARARGQCRVRPGRPATCPIRPVCSSPSTPGWRQPSCDDSSRPGGAPLALPAGAGSQMTAPQLHAAIDLGASSARLFAGRLDRGRLVTTEVTRLPNGPVRLPRRVALGHPAHPPGHARRTGSAFPAGRRGTAVGRDRRLGRRLRPSRRSGPPARARLSTTGTNGRLIAGSGGPRGGRVGPYLRRHRRRRRWGSTRFTSSWPSGAALPTPGPPSCCWCPTSSLISLPASAASSVPTLPRPSSSTCERVR